MTNDENLPHWSATRLAAAIRAREVSAEDVLRAHLARIAEWNPVLRAIVWQAPEEDLVAAARLADRAVAAGEPLGPLHGLPVAVHDVVHVRGMPTGHGSLVHLDDPVPGRDGVLPERLRAAGAIIVGKTNTSEHGIGALTANRVYGTTVNPWDTSRHAGGSSGGSAAAVAAGMVALADGFDSAGNVRFPAAMCGIAGIRPTPGTIPSARPGNAWSPLGVLGLFGRTSADLGLGLSGVSALDRRWPLSWVEDPADMARIAPVDIGSLRVAWTDDLGGLPVEADVAAAHAAARTRLETAGVRLSGAQPDFSGVDEAWEAVEMFEAFSTGRHDEAVHGKNFEANFLDNNAHGARITATELSDAFDRRTVLFRDMESILDDHDVLVAPAVPMAAPPADVSTVRTVAGIEYDRYYDWQRLATRLTMTVHPVVVVPCGLTADGLPVGVQVVGRHRGERRLIEVAAALESAFAASGRVPSAVA